MKKLLIIVDYQNDFVTGALGFAGAEKLTSPIKERILTQLENGDDIIYTLDSHDEKYMNTMEGNKLPVPHCIKGTWGHQIVSECDFTSKAIKVFEKPTFPSLELANYLKDKDYEEIELCGLVSSICVLSNAVMVKSALPNAKIIVRKSLTSSYDLVMNDKCFDILSNIHIDVID